MPMDRSRYPKDWDAIAHRIKEAAGWSCQSCGRKCRRAGEPETALYKRLDSASQNELIAYPRRFILTVAHLDHDPENPNARLAALCAPCHCRYDLAQMKRKKQLKQESLGQMRLRLELDLPAPAGQGKDPSRIQLAIEEPI